MAPDKGPLLHLNAGGLVVRTLVVVAAAPLRSEQLRLDLFRERENVAAGGTADKHVVRHVYRDLGLVFGDAHARLVIRALHALLNA